jgi:hypothetical protein
VFPASPMSHPTIQGLRTEAAAQVNLRSFSGSEHKKDLARPGWLFITSSRPQPKPNHLMAVPLETVSLLREADLGGVRGDGDVLVAVQG